MNRLNEKWEGGTYNDSRISFLSSFLSFLANVFLLPADRRVMDVKPRGRRPIFPLAF